MRITSRPLWQMALFSLLCVSFVFLPRTAGAQGKTWWEQYKAACRAKGGTICDVYNECGGVCTIRPRATTPGNSGNPQGDDGAAAEAEAQRQRDAEVEQQRIEADNKRRAEEAAKQAKFNQDKQEALGQLKGISQGGDFDSDSGLKGAGSTDLGLKDVRTSGGSLELKTLPDVNTGTNAAVLVSAADQNREASRILAGIRKIKVPPPVLPEDAVLAFGQLVPDEKSRRIIERAEAGVAVLDMVGKLGQATIASKVLFSAGKTFIAAENGADVYLVKQNEAYERALAYLKDANSRKQFVEIVRDLRENKPLPEDASIDMARAAQAILDPKLGNGGMHIAWDAMLSPEARHAALTQACIELAGHAFGAASEKTVSRIVAAQQPAFQEASDFLSHARIALERAQDPGAIESLHLAIKQANEMIAASYRVAKPAGKQAEDFGYSFFTREAEGAAERSFERNKKQ